MDRSLFTPSKNKILVHRDPNLPVQWDTVNKLMDSDSTRHIYSNSPLPSRISRFKENSVYHRSNTTYSSSKAWLLYIISAGSRIRSSSYRIFVFAEIWTQIIIAPEHVYLLDYFLLTWKRKEHLIVQISSPKRVS